MGYQIRNALAFCNCDPCCSSDLVSPKRSATGPQFRRWILVPNVNVKVTSGCCIGRRALQVCNFSANHPQKIGNGSLLSPAPKQKSDSATTEVSWLFQHLPTIGYNGCKLPEIPKSALWPSLVPAEVGEFDDASPCRSGFAMTWKLLALVSIAAAMHGRIQCPGAQGFFAEIITAMVAVNPLLWHAVLDSYHDIYTYIYIYIYHMDET